LGLGSQAGLGEGKYRENGGISRYEGGIKRGGILDEMTGYVNVVCGVCVWL